MSCASPSPLNHINSKIPLVIMYVDLVGSTKMNMTLPVDNLVSIIRAFTYEMSSATGLLIYVNWRIRFCSLCSNTFVVTGNHVSQYGKVSLTTIQMSRHDFSNVKGMHQFSNFPLCL